MRWGVVLLMVALALLQLGAMPTVYHCLVSEEWMWRFTGKAHCELQGWRHILRGMP